MITVGMNIYSYQMPQWVDCHSECSIVKKCTINVYSISTSYQTCFGGKSGDVRPSIGGPYVCLPVSTNDGRFRIAVRSLSHHHHHRDHHHHRRDHGNVNFVMNSQANEIPSASLQAFPSKSLIILLRNPGNRKPPILRSCSPAKF